MASILIVEDNDRLVEGLTANLEVEGYVVHSAPDPAAGTALVAKVRPDLIVLDLMFPEGDGFSFLESLRASGNDVPVIILSARGEELDRVRGFRRGADDYVVKPFGVMELLLRVAALLRRSGRSDARAPGGGDAPAFGDVEVDRDARIVRKSGTVVHLTPRAFDLLLSLLDRAGKVATRLDLMREVWGHRAAVQSRTVDAHVAELRHALEDDPSAPKYIVTVWKAGYRLQKP